MAMQELDPPNQPLEMATEKLPEIAKQVESTKPYLGYVAALLALLIWSGWVVATRAQSSTLAPHDVAWLRYCIPALLLSPIWLRRGILPKNVSKRRLAIMTLGWGAPFVLLTAKGLQTVPASLYGPLVPAALPLFVAMWDKLVERQSFSASRAIGLWMIVGSCAIVLVPALMGDDLTFISGAPWLLAGALGWAAFTIAFRGSGLTGLEAAAYISLYSAPFMMIMGLWNGLALFDPHLALSEAFSMLVVHGVLAGAVAVASFAYAVSILGAGCASSFTSLIPVGAAVGGWLLLGETVSGLQWVAIGSATIGVAMVNGVVAKFVGWVFSRN